jgi:hypothetical protein
VSDPVLLNGLQTELSTVRQDPTAYPSAWATGLGVPQDIRFGPAGSGGGAAGGYRVNPEQLRDWIAELQDIVGWVDDRARHIRIIRESRPPAPDGSSAKANGAYVQAGGALQRSNDAIRNYASQLVTALQDSLRAYENTEQSNQDSLRNLGVDR